MLKEVKFSDLNDRLKEEAIDYFRSNYSDYLEPNYDWYEGVIEQFIEIYENAGFTLNVSDVEFDVYEETYKFPCEYTKQEYPKDELIDLLFKHDYLGSLIFRDTLYFINDEIDNNYEESYELLDLDDFGLSDDIEKFAEREFSNKEQKDFFISLLEAIEFSAIDWNNYRLISENKDVIEKIFFRKIDKEEMVKLNGLKWDELYGDEIWEETKDKLNEYVDGVIENLTDKLSSIVDEFKSALKSEYEWYFSDERIKDILENDVTIIIDCPDEDDGDCEIEEIEF